MLSILEARKRASSPSITQQQRVESLACLVAHLDKSKREDDADVLSNLQAVKLLGRVADGSDILAESSTILMLAGYAGCDLRDSHATVHATEVNLEAWRIICNAAKLHKEAAVSLEGMDKVLEHIMVSLGPPTSPKVQFLASRCLFLTTVKGGEINRTLVEVWNAAGMLHKAFQNYLNIALDKKQSWNTDDMAALSEHLKLLYNLTIFYPRLQALEPTPKGDSLSKANLDTISMATSQPMALSNSQSSSGSSRLTRGLNAVRSMLPHNSSRPTSPVPPNSLMKTEPLVKSVSLSELSSDLINFILLGTPPTSAAFVLQPPTSHAIHALSELPTSVAWFEPFTDVVQASKAQNNAASGEATKSLPPLINKLLSLLDAHLGQCFPGVSEPDASDNRNRIAASIVDADPISIVDTSLAPLLLLLRKCIIAESSGDSAAGIHTLLLGPQVDRTMPLEKHDSLVGRLVRLMGSIYFGNLKVGAGEFLFALCKQDPDRFAQSIGYGTASGFLVTNGLLVPPPEQAVKSSHGVIDPITGAYAQPESASQVPMSESEKEREAERLYVLFDRLAKNGTISMDNPIRMAQQQGRFEDISDQDIDGRLRQEQDDEAEAEAEMSRWKNRNQSRK